MPYADRLLGNPAAHDRRLPFHCVLFGDLVLDANSADRPPASSYSVAWSLKNDVEVHAYSNDLFNTRLCRQAVVSTEGAL